jgi:nucleoid DNA-binding protein
LNVCQGRVEDAPKVTARVVFRFRFRYDLRSLEFKTSESKNSGAAARAPKAQARSRGEKMPTVVTKSDLVQVAAKAGNVSKAAAGEAVNALFDAIVENVAKGKRVTVVGFGTFLPRKRKARAGRSPANGKEIKIRAKTLPAFAAGQGFKEAVDKA